MELLLIGMGIQEAILLSYPLFCTFYVTYKIIKWFFRNIKKIRIRIEN
jgi:hypothetical protein